MKKQRILGVLMAGVLIFALCGAVSVQAAVESAYLGLGPVIFPDYEGSDDYAIFVAPLANVKWDNHMYINLQATQAWASIIPSATWIGGPVVEFIPKRGSNVDNSAVSDLDTVDASLMAGGFFGFQVGHWTAMLEAMWDVASGNKGAIARLRCDYLVPLNDKVYMKFRFFSTYAESDYMDAYFTITPEESLKSGLDTFSADSGIKDAGGTLFVSYSPWQKWDIVCAGQYTRLFYDAKNSPVTDDEGNPNQFLGGIFAIYNF
jgi:outer membrane scaffolding protein for murein synthesis (MipA/OmpV family)